MTMRLFCLLALLVAAPACGSRRIAGYLEDLENCSATSSTTDEPGTTQSSGSSEDTTSSSSSGTTVEGSETGTSTSTSTGNLDTTEATTQTSTGEPMAECGNGMLEAFGLVPEECDDGNLDPDDGCSDTCALDRRVFVTSELFKGGDFESLYLADALCANFADDQGWPDGLKYRAWLSDSTTDARDRFTRGRGRLVMTNGLVFAQSWSALLAGQLDNPLEVTEKSETYHGGVWTGTRPNGTAVPEAEYCEDWATEMALKTGHYGYSDRTTAEWTLAEGFDQPSPCIADYALYCFQSL